MTQLSKGVSSVLNKAVGLITANYSAKHRTAVSEVRPIASLPYMGRYRVMDFALSNMVNCGLRTVGFIMPDNYRSLVDHIDSGKDWMLGRKNGGLFILPGSSFGTTRTGYRFLLRDLLQNKAFLRRNSQPYVILSTANMVYNMDYAKLVEAHEASGADITLATFHAVENDDDVVRIELKDGQVADIHQGATATSWAPMPLAPRMPKHCRKLISPNTAPMAVPPHRPMAMPAIATGIMLKVMLRPKGIGML